MAKSAPTATVVRSWAEGQGLIGSGQRGRLGTEVVKAYNKAHPRNKYVITYTKAEAPKVKVTAKAPGKAPVTRKVVVSEVRAAARKAGVEVPSRGRLPQSILTRHVLGEF